MGNSTTAHEDKAPSAEAVNPDGEVGGLRSWYRDEKGKISREDILRISYLVLAAITIKTLCVDHLISVGVIATSVASAITLKLFTTDQSGRLVGLIILAFIAASALSVSIYALVAVVRKKEKPVHAVDPLALRRDLGSLCIFHHIYNRESSEELFGLIPAAEFQSRTSRQNSKFPPFQPQYPTVNKFDVEPAATASITLIVLAILAAIVVGVSVPVSWENEQHLSTSLKESFTLSIVDRNKANKWANIQSSLSCCGANAASDYKMPGQPFLPPLVPISCCPAYDSSRSELAQEREKLTCREQRLFYSNGCLVPVLAKYRHIAHVVLGVSVLYIVFMVSQAIIGEILTRKQPLHPNPEPVHNSPPIQPPPQPATPAKVPASKQKAKLSIS